MSNQENESRNDTSDVKLWLRMLSCVKLIETDLRKKLRENFEFTLPRFDLLSQLQRYPEGIKMKELSRLMLVTDGNITSLVDGLEKMGLAERILNDQDRRSNYIKITPQGNELFELISIEHKKWLDGLLKNINPQDKTLLYDLLSTLKNSLTKE